MGVCAAIERIRDDHNAYQRGKYRALRNDEASIRADQMTLLDRWLALPLSERVARKDRWRAQRAIGDES